MRRPPTREGEVWLHQYTSAFMRWARSSYADTPALTEAAAALESLLERCPDYAAEVERLASRACFASRRAQVPHLVVRLAGVGLEAGAMAATDGGASNASAILLLSLAEAQLHAEQRLDGLDALQRLEQRLRASTTADALAPWLTGRMHVLFGELHELGLEHAQARRAYEAALQAIAPLLHDEPARAAFVRAWHELLDEQPAGDSSASEVVALLDLHTLAVSSAIGLARSLGDTAPAEERAAAAREAWRLLDEYGPPADLSPFDVIPVIGSLPSNEAGRFGAALVAVIEKRRLQLEKAEVPPGITHPDAIAIVQRAQQRQAALLERQRGVYEIIGTLGVALAQRGEGRLAEAEATSVDAIKAAIGTRLGGPQVCAFAVSLEIAAARDRRRASDLVDIFMMALAATIESDPSFFASPRIRALLDEALATAAGLTLEHLGDGTDVHTRRRASALLDLLRRPDPPPPGILMPKGPSRLDTGPAADAALAAADTLGRIRVALRTRQDTIALVIQSVGSNVAFLILSGDDPPIQHVVASAEYQASARALAEAAGAAITDERPTQTTDDEVEAAGRRAFALLPDAVRQAVAGHRTVLLAPDFRGRQDTVPYELMHDGTGYLAATRILARFTSLAHLATTLDTRIRLPRRRRALVVAAPVVDGYDALDLAPLEQEEVTATLTQHGFDAPTIDPARLSGAFLTDRLGYVDVLHVSAHGESAADREWLVLPHGQRLLVEDLLQTPQYRVPFVYLNTCSLGQTRYLGAGVSRGLAYSCAELGAPAVVAHPTPVPDQAALRLAIAFYDGATDRGVGEALLDARRTLLDEGESPVALASALLIGDPDHAIVADRERELEDVASDLLDSYMTVSGDESRQAAAWTAAAAAVHEHEHPRVEAALSLVQTMVEVRDLDDPRQAAALDAAIGVADTLRHLPARALLRFVKAVHADDASSDAAAALLDEAIRYLAPLAAFEPAWTNLLSTAREKLAVRKMTAREFEIQTHLPEGQQDDGSMRRLMEALMGAQQGVEERFGAATIRDVEQGIDDVLWNAVVAGHPNRFSDAPEAVAFARQVAQKLERHGALPAAARRTAPVMLAGLLRHLWDTQNLNYLANDVAEGQAGTVRALVDDIRAHWAPPDGQPWYVLVEPAGRLVDDVLAFIDTLSWEDVYKHLDPRMDALADQLKGLLDQVRLEQPAALGACAAYVSGTVLAKNQFSPLDGSVPEDIGARLTKVAHALDADNESRFFGYLSTGYEAIRHRPVDELTRWRMEPAQS